MATVALVSVTLNAVNPMTEFLRKADSKLKVVNYLDGHLMEKVRQEGGITPAAMERMEYMLHLACDDGADAVLLTCTAFSKYADVFAKKFPKPIICPDRAMLEAVAARGSKTVILCTFTGTVETTKALYLECCRRAGTPEQVDMVVLPEAASASARGDFAEHDRLIRQKAVEMDESYDSIVLAQISMANAGEGLALQHAKLFTSPQSAYDALCAKLQA